MRTTVILIGAVLYASVGLAQPIAGPVGGPGFGPPIEDVNELTTLKSDVPMLSWIASRVTGSINLLSFVDEEDFFERRGAPHDNASLLKYARFVKPGSVPDDLDVATERIMAIRLLGTRQHRPAQARLHEIASGDQSRTAQLFALHAEQRIGVTLASKFLFTPAKKGLEWIPASSEGIIKLDFAKLALPGDTISKFERKPLLWQPNDDDRSVIQQRLFGSARSSADVFYVLAEVLASAQVDRLAAGYGKLNGQNSRILVIEGIGNWPRVEKLFRIILPSAQTLRSKEDINGDQIAVTSIHSRAHDIAIAIFGRDPRQVAERLIIADVGNGALLGNGQNNQALDLIKQSIRAAKNPANSVLDRGHPLSVPLSKIPETAIVMVASKKTLDLPNDSGLYVALSPDKGGITVDYGSNNSKNADALEEWMNTTFAVFDGLKREARGRAKVDKELLFSQHVLDLIQPEYQSFEGVAVPGGAVLPTE